ISSTDSPPGWPTINGVPADLNASASTSTVVVTDRLPSRCWDQSLPYPCARRSPRRHPRRKRECGRRTQVSSCHHSASLWSANLARRSFLEILPVAVIGRASTNTTSSGSCHLAIFEPSVSRISALVGLAPGAFTTTSSGRSCHLGCGTPITAQLAMPLQAMAAFSTSMELIHSPPDLTRSLVRSTISSQLSGVTLATSPVPNQPSLSICFEDASGLLK